MELYLLRHGDAAEPGMKKMNEINEDYSRRKKILLVGHEPNLSALISVLISGRDDVSVKIKKGDCANCRPTRSGSGSVPRWNG